MEKKRLTRTTSIGVGVALGISIGVTIGAVTDNGGVWIAIVVVVGAALGVVMNAVLESQAAVGSDEEGSADNGSDESVE
jgi:hypothetical protein